MRSKTKAKVGIAGLGAVALSLTAVLPAAHADYQPGPSDVVGVGGDTPQFALQFLSDGSTAAGGYNTTGNSYKLVTFNATADANARNAYAQNSTESAPKPLNPTDVLRAGTVPVQRVQSSGNAITALLADTGATEKINFVFSASEPTAAQQTAAGNTTSTGASSTWGYLHVVRFATDSVQIAAANTSNAPAGLSIAELLGIYKGTYTHWNDLPGNSSGSADTIIPELPPTSSSIYKTLVADLKTANSNVAPTLSNPNIVTVEQNDPTAITAATKPSGDSDSDAASTNAIVPFSAGRLALWNSAYFHDPNVAFPGNSTALTPGIQLLSGTTPDASATNTAYNSPINDYVIFRQSDTGDAPWQPGGTQNWATALFIASGTSTHPYLKTNGGLADIAAAGITPAYADLTNASAG